MISEREAAKVYDRNTKVVRRGDPGWSSDNVQDGRQGESYGSNPLSKIEQGIARRRSHAITPEADPNTLGPGVRDVTGDGRDAFYWEVQAGERGNVWRLRFTDRNADR